MGSEVEVSTSSEGAAPMEQEQQEAKQEQTQQQSEYAPAGWRATPAGVEAMAIALRVTVEEGARARAALEAAAKEIARLQGKVDGFQKDVRFLEDANRKLTREKQALKRAARKGSK